MNNSIWREQAAGEFELTCFQESVLFNDGKLTAYLKKFFGNKIRFCLISEAWGLPTAEEGRALNLMIDDSVWLRRSEWRCNDQVLVSAKMIIPKSLAMSEPAFFALGERPLGSVYQDEEKLRRRSIEVTRLDPQHDYYQLLPAAQRSFSDETCLARRSRFTFEQKFFLVCEIFSPRFWDFALSV